MMPPPTRKPGNRRMPRCRAGLTGKTRRTASGTSPRIWRRPRHNYSTPLTGTRTRWTSAGNSKAPRRRPRNSAWAWGLWRPRCTGWKTTGSSSTAFCSAGRKSTATSLPSRESGMFMKTCRKDAKRNGWAGCWKGGIRNTKAAWPTFPT